MSRDFGLDTRYLPPPPFSSKRARHPNERRLAERGRRSPSTGLRNIPRRVLRNSRDGEVARSEGGNALPRGRNFPQPFASAHEGKAELEMGGWWGALSSRDDIAGDGIVVGVGGVDGVRGGRERAEVGRGARGRAQLDAYLAEAGAWGGIAINLVVVRFDSWGDRRE